MGEELFEAVYGGADDTLVRLLRGGGDPEAVDGYGVSALYAAAVCDRPGAVRLLLAAGADPDRASGPEGADLPLCGAASGGHTEVVRALLAAGAVVDRREAFGFTASAWAVVQGFPETLEVLLRAGAEPDLPGPGGERPLLLAARRGSAAAVRMLLRFGAGAHDRAVRAAALAEARHWMALTVEDLVREVRAALVGAYGEDGYETVVRRAVVGGAETVTVELLRDGVPVAGQTQETGHAAVVTVLEGALGVEASAEELAGRALACGDPARDDWTEVVAVLRRRGDEATFRAAAGWLAEADPARQMLGADVLAGLGAGATDDGRGLLAFAAEAVPLLRAMARRAVTPGPVGAAVAALGRYRSAAALPEIVRHGRHRDAEVRRRVAIALRGLVREEHAEALRLLVALGGDRSAGVREEAVAGLAEVAGPAAAEALAARLDDDEPEVAARAAAVLAERQDVRVPRVLERLLIEAAPGSTARARAAAAVGHLPEGPVRRRLERIEPRRRPAG